MILWVFKNILSLMILGIFATLVFVKVASHDEEDVMGDVGGFGFGDSEEKENDEGEEDNAERVYQPHMWKGLGFWMVIVYGLINIFMISRFFK